VEDPVFISKKAAPILIFCAGQIVENRDRPDKLYMDLPGLPRL